MSTLATGGFLDVISALRRLCAAADKKSYTFLIGKPNPAKLGNFPEVRGRAGGRAGEGWREGNGE